MIPDCRLYVAVHAGSGQPTVAPGSGLPSVEPMAATKARSMVQILKAGEIDAKRNEAAVMVPVVLDAGRTVRANLTFDAGLLEAIDAEASRRGLTRSSLPGQRGA